MLVNLGTMDCKVFISRLSYINRCEILDKKEFTIFH